MHRLSSIPALLILLLLASSSSAQTDAGCKTDKCHADMGTKEFVHGPVGAGICTICHTPVEGKKHQFEFYAPKEELCFGCHETSRDMMLQDNLHTPVADGNCVGCHDPHQSDFRFTLKGKAASLCYQCHQQSKFTEGHVHGPVAGGDCNVCHNPHASPNEYQLQHDPKELCVRCHEEKAGIMQMRHIHPPVAEKCTNCHNPHADEAKYMLVADVPELCSSCHEEIGAGTVTHEPVASGQCNKCHDVHASENPNMFHVPPTDLCFSCHEEMKSYVDEHEFKHGPVKDGDCNACHDPHGSDNYRILKKFFPQEFYMPYETEHYAACFDCHNKDLALNESTTTLTDFRDGKLNLHFVHVNKEVKGRSCKACHQAHATNQEKHIRASVPFGSMNWDLPVEFTKTEHGGSCVVGCHAPKEYNRK